MSLKNISWTEKYRPDKVDNVIGSFKDKIKKYLENPTSIPNFLFYSKTPGTGKTSLAKAIIHDLKCDALVLNSSDERKIETVRDKIKDFARTVSSNGKRKCCFLDEMDGLTKIAQEAMRNTMETYSANVFFILTCNNIDKVHDAIQSRCVVVPFTKPNKESIISYLTWICQEEQIGTNPYALEKLVNIFYPSIRDCVNYLQDLKTQGKDLTEDNIYKHDNEYKEIWDMIKSDKFIEAKTEILENGIDCLLLNRWIFYNLFNENLELKNLVKLIQITGDNEINMRGADTAIIFISSIPNIIMGLK